MSAQNIGLIRPILRALGDFQSTMEKLLPVPDQQLLSTAGDLTTQVSYNDACQIFNQRFQEKPWFIVYCRSHSDVKNTYTTAIELGFQIRIRAGGHDHEGECTGTNTILIDVSEMKDVKVDHATNIATIGPGNRFQKLTSDLADEDVMLPHGTCATVGIAGFVMGGGWGPWTRKHGMACEWLDGANLVLGDGTEVSVDKQGNEVPRLLWALRGGGGMSYGLVTEFRIKTFDLPEELIRFDIVWNPYKNETDGIPQADYATIQVLQAWEDIIDSTETSKLIGTNLMINALPWEKGKPVHAETVAHNCKMFGYWEGNLEDLETEINKWFVKFPKMEVTYDPHHGGTGSTDDSYGSTLMSNWARESYNQILTAKYRNGASVALSSEDAALLKEGKPLPPDYDLPAPHKITSRLVERGTPVEDKARQLAMITSLCSDLLFEENRSEGLFTYVTLGAIVGDYYLENPGGGDCAFPYADMLYTLQYQCWWNTEYEEKALAQNNPVYKHSNRGLDWIEISRDYHIPKTTGSFISFKDSSIPTEVYFAQNYQKLIDVKKDYSKDPDNHFRIRKSII